MSSDELQDEAHAAVPVPLGLHGLIGGGGGGGGGASDDGDSGGKKKLKVRACTHCAESHAACNEERPCERCKKRGIECVDKPSKRPLKQMRTAKSSSKMPSGATNYDSYLTHMAAGYGQPTPELVDYYRRATAPTPAPHFGMQSIASPNAASYDPYGRVSQQQQQQQQQQQHQQQASYYGYAQPLSMPTSAAPNTPFFGATPSFGHRGTGSTSSLSQSPYSQRSDAFGGYPPISLSSEGYGARPASPPAYAQWPPSPALPLVATPQSLGNTPSSGLPTGHSSSSSSSNASLGSSIAVSQGGGGGLGGLGLSVGGSGGGGGGGGVDAGSDTHRAFLPFKGVRRKPVVFQGTYNQHEAAIELAPSTSVADLRALVQERLGAQDEELLLTYMRGGDRVVVHDETDLDQLLANPHLGEIELFVKRGRLASTSAAHGHGLGLAPSDS